jgi:predicted ribosome quality control (RQC) complex YloA/Tae2 family protein
LVERVRSASPLAAREMVYRATGDAEAAAGAVVDPVRLAAALHGLFAPVAAGGWAPSVVRSEDGISAYAPYLLTHLPGVEPAAGVSQAIEAYEASRLGEDAYREARRETLAAVDAARSRLERTRVALLAGLRTEEELAALKMSGDLILACQSSISKGAVELLFPLDDAEPMRIALDPTLRPVDNAEHYYAAYKKARRAAAALPTRLEAIDRDLDYCAALRLDAEQAQGRSELDEVGQALVDAGLVGRSARGAGRRGKAGPSGGRSASRPAATQPRRFLTGDGFVAWVGRNSRQNELVTFTKGKPGDIWLHALGVPGAHVLVKAAGRQVPPATLLEAAKVAAHFSAARSERRAEVVITDVARVRRMPGGRQGQVRHQGGQTVVVEPGVPTGWREEG